MDAAHKIDRVRDEIERVAGVRLLHGREPAATAAVQGAARLDLRAQPAQRFDLRELGIAVVDDAKPSMDVILKILLGFGVTRTLAFSSVARAMSRLSSDPFDLVIADAEMPGEDGFDLVRRLRADPDGPNHTTAVMLASGHTPLSKIARARDVGANMVILKPISPVVLLSHIEWLAKTPRPFVSSPNYCGPCRRVRQQPLPGGMAERRAQPAYELHEAEIHGEGAH